MGSPSGTGFGTYGTRLADNAREAFLNWRGGDERGLDALVRLLTPLLWHLARSYRIDAAQAEDAVQSTWVALVRGAERVQDPQAVLRWLAVTVQREAARCAKSGARVEPTDPLVMAQGAIAARTPREPSPEDSVLRDSQAATLWRHVAALSERCQRLLRVIAFDDHPDYATLSDALSMPVGSIGPTRGRCLGKLRDALDADPHWVWSR